MASEDYKESEMSKIVKRLMDEEGFEFGEAVREAMEQTKNFESKALTAMCFYDIFVFFQSFLF